MKKSRNYQFWQTQVALLLNSVESLEDDGLAKYLLWKYQEVIREISRFDLHGWKRYIGNNADSLNLMFGTFYELSKQAGLVFPIRFSLFILKSPVLRRVCIYALLILLLPIFLIMALIRLPVEIVRWGGKLLRKVVQPVQIVFNGPEKDGKESQKEPDSIEEPNVIFLTGYTVRDRFPLYQFCAARDIDIENYTIITDSAMLAETFGDSTKVELIPMRGSSVVDKDKEIEIYTEAFRTFDNLINLTKTVQYRDVPIVYTFVSTWLSKAQIVAMLNELLIHLIKSEKSATNIMYLTEGNDFFTANMLDLLFEEHGLSQPSRFNLIRHDFAGYKLEFKHIPFLRDRQFSFLPYDPQLADTFQERSQSLDRFYKLLPTGIASIASIPVQIRYPLNLVYKTMMEFEGESPVLVVVQADRKSIYWKATESVLKSLKSKNKSVFAITERASTYLALKDLGVGCVFYPDIFTPEANGEINNAANEIYKEFITKLEFDLVQTNPEGERIKYFDEKAVRSVIKAIKSANTLRQVKNRIFYQKLLSDFIVEKRPSSLFVIPYLTPRCELSVLIARTLGLPSLAMPTVTVDSNRRSIPMNWDTDIIACYGEQCRRAFQTLGHASKSLQLTGNATLDDLLNTRDSVDEEKLERELGISANTKIVLIATSRIDLEEHRWINPLLDYAEKTGGMHVVIKPHPSFGVKSYSQVRKSQCLTISDTLVLHDVMKSCSVLVTDYSTTGAEAALLGKDVVVVNMLGKKYPSNRYDEMGIAKRISRVEDVPEVFDSLLVKDNNEELERAREIFINEYNMFNDGKAGDRIAEILISPELYMSDAVEEDAQVAKA